ncbi:MAG: hypothetical protein ACRDYE_13405, partial [Acidimicrobiales bacterium]
MPGPDPLGKRALFWMPVEAEDLSPRRHDVRRARPVGRHALFSEAAPAGEEETASRAALSADPVPPRGLFVVSCSSCGSVTRIGLLELLWCQLPVAAWLPRRVFDRWMTCPSCRQRTWASVTL